VTAFNNLKILVRACSTSPKYWPLSTIWRFLSELVLLLPNTDSFQQLEQALTKSSNCWRRSVFSRGRTSSDKNLQIVRFCQSLFYSYQILTAFKNLKIFIRACSTSTKYWLPSTIWRFLSELVLFLLYTDRLQQFEDFCPYLVEVEQALTKSANCSKLSVFGRSRTNSALIFKLLKTVSITTIWRFLSELVLLLSSDRLQQFEDFC
jgi:hypothetical protein